MGYLMNSEDIVRFLISPTLEILVRKKIITRKEADKELDNMYEICRVEG